MNWLDMMYKARDRFIPIFETYKGSRVIESDWKPNINPPWEDKSIMDILNGHEAQP